MSTILVGLEALRRQLSLKAPEAAHQSFVGPRSIRRTEERDGRVTESYPARFTVEDTLLGHLRFALKHEPLDLAILNALFETMNGEEIRDWVLAEPTSAFARRAWFLFEFLRDTLLDLPPAGAGAYVPVLDPDLHFVAQKRHSTRHRVADNLLGVRSFCPSVRRTARLVRSADGETKDKARRLIAEISPETLGRAINYLYTKETRSSFDIEHEKPSNRKIERFVAALRGAAAFDPTRDESLIGLQNEIVDPRFAAKGYRAVQNFVGERIRDYEKVHFISPKPEDVAALMRNWQEMCSRLLEAAVDPVVAAALVAFAFVFIHPFEDGNGRIHRFLVHCVLARKKFSPEDVVFPISAAIVRDLKTYDCTLEAFSRPLLDRLDWVFDHEDRLKVEGNEADLYRYFDATPMAEFLYEKVIETVEVDLPEELSFLDRFDKCRRAVQAIIDMPDRRLSLLVQLCLQNGGRFPKRKRGLFSELEEGEIALIDSAILEILGSSPAFGTR
jgi:Fic/DOC family